MNVGEASETLGEMINSGSLEPKPPEFLQNLKWLLVHGWQHKGYVLVAVIVGLTYWLLGHRSTLESEHAVLGTEHSSALPASSGASNRRTETGPPPPTNDGVGVVPQSTGKETAASAPAGLPADDRGTEVPFLLEESAGAIIEVLRRAPYFNHERITQDLFQGRWVAEAGWVGVVVELPSKMSDQWSLAVHEVGTDVWVGLQTKEDCSYLRVGQRIRFKGRLRSVSSPPDPSSPRYGMIWLDDSMILPE